MVAFPLLERLASEPGGPFWPSSISAPTPAFLPRSGSRSTLCLEDPVSFKIFPSARSCHLGLRESLLLSAPSREQSTLPRDEHGLSLWPSLCWG